jgi:hypothetical protein
LRGRDEGVCDIMQLKFGQIIKARRRKRFFEIKITGDSMYLHGQEKVIFNIVMYEIHTNYYRLLK